MAIISIVATAVIIAPTVQERTKTLAEVKEKYSQGNRKVNQWEDHCTEDEIFGTEWVVTSDQHEMHVDDHEEA